MTDQEIYAARKAGISCTVRRDGLDFAAVRALTSTLPRENGRPAAEVDAVWHLTIYNTPVYIGQEITLLPDGFIEIGANQ